MKWWQLRKIQLLLFVVYFSDKLATLYDFHYKGTNQWKKVLTKIVQCPSEFEVLAEEIADEGVLVWPLEKKITKQKVIAPEFGNVELYLVS